MPAFGLFGIRALQNIINNLLNRARIQPKQVIIISLMGLVAHYFGFMWALTNFDPFYSDWMFFINLSLGFIFALALAALGVQLIVSALSLVDFLFSAIFPDRLMRLDRILRFRIPVLRIQIVGYSLLGSLFLLFLLVIYTDMNWWQIMLSLSMIPLTAAIGALLVYQTIRHHKIESVEFDLGEKFEVTAENLDNVMQSIEHAELQLERYIASHLPANLRAIFEEIVAYMHSLAASLGEKIPDKEVVHQEITHLQLQIAELRWDIAYARFAMPKIRSMLYGVGLVFCILLGFFHASNYINNHNMLLTNQDGETRQVTPIIQRGSWQVLYENGEILLENRDNLMQLEPVK